MADKLLISITAREVHAARWRGGAIAGLETFANDENGLAEFEHYLTRAGRPCAEVLVNAVEEDYRVESLPHSFGAERAEMLNRKLRQYYRNTPYVSARLRGRDAGKRRDDQFLFCALTNPDLIAGWMQALEKHGLPVAGIYLRPTLASQLAEKFQIKDDKLLIVSIDGPEVRLTFLREQKLRISRLARVETVESNRGYVEEISNTRLYLHALRILTLDEPLSVLVVDPGDTHVELVRTLGAENPILACRRLGRQELIKQLGIAPDMVTAAPAAIALHLLGLGAPDDNLAPEAVTALYRRGRTQRSLYKLAAAALVAGCTWSAVTWYQIWEVRSEIETQASQTRQLQTQYLQATRLFPAAPDTAENMRRAVDISQRIGTVMRSPEPLLTLVSRVLDDNPAIALNTLGWKHGRTEIESDRGRKVKTAASETAASNAPTGGIAGNTAGGTAGTRKLSGLIEGEVRPFLGDYRGAIQTIDRFAEALSARPEVAEVRVVKMPLNISPELTLSGNTAESREHSGKADFKLLLILKAAP